MIKDNVDVENMGFRDVDIGGFFFLNFRTQEEPDSYAGVGRRMHSSLLYLGFAKSRKSAVHKSFSYINH